MPDEDLMQRAREIVEDWHGIDGPLLVKDIAHALAAHGDTVRRETREECAVVAESTQPMGEIGDVLDGDPYPQRRAALATRETIALNIRALNEPDASERYKDTSQGG